MDGSRPPPCAYFSVTMIDEESAVMFGGHTSGWSADVYTLYLPTMVSTLSVFMILRVSIWILYVLLPTVIYSSIHICIVIISEIITPSMHVHLA